MLKVLKEKALVQNLSGYHIHRKLSRPDVKNFGGTDYVKRNKINRVLYRVFFPLVEIMAPITQFRASFPGQEGLFANYSKTH